MRAASDVCAGRRERIDAPAGEDDIKTKSSVKLFLMGTDSV
jgi:hypothetical protein